MLNCVEPYEGDKPFVFVSYCRDEAEKVYPLINALAERGCRIWYDIGLHAGADWPDAIARRLNDCSVFLCIISVGSEASYNCKNELTSAVIGNKPIIPVIMDDVKLSAGTRLNISSFMYLEAKKYSPAELVSSILSSNQIKACIGSGNNSVTDVEKRREEEECKRREAEEKECRRREEEEKELKRREAEEKERRRREEEEKELKRREAEERERRLREKAGEDEPTETEGQDPFGKTVKDDDLFNATVAKSSAANKYIIVRLSTGESYIRSSQEVSLGRKPANSDISFPECGNISACHAKIINHNGTFRIFDNNSTNGTAVNGEVLPSGETRLLDPFSIFALDTEEFVIVHGKKLEPILKAKHLLYLRSLINDEIMFVTEEMLLDRQNSWPRGTLKDDRKISRTHAKLTLTPTGCCIEDTGSTNGTRINNVKINESEPVSLKDGDIIRIGNTELIFHDVRI